MSEETKWQGENRRKTPKTRDGLYRFIIGVNATAWLFFVVALVLFHYARPELISGVQTFWGMDGRTNWSMHLSGYLVGMLALCALLSVVVMILKRQRSRRKNDFFGMNAIFLLVVTGGALLWIYSETNDEPALGFINHIVVADLHISHWSAC